MGAMVRRRLIRRPDTRHDIARGAEGLGLFGNELAIRGLVVPTESLELASKLVR